MTNNCRLSADINSLLTSSCRKPKEFCSVSVWFKNSSCASEDVLHLIRSPRAHSRCSVKWTAELISIWMPSGSYYGAMGAVTLIVCVFLYVRVWKTDEREQKKKRGNHNSILLFFFLNGLFHQTDCMFEQIAGGGVMKTNCQMWMIQVSTCGSVSQTCFDCLRSAGC